MPEVREVDTSGRKGDWVSLRFTERFFFEDPRPQDFCIEDVAHGLSMICRFGGHVPVYYSVAQHSVLVASQVPPALRREALLHDRAEAYLGSDLVRPIKRALSYYEDMERRILHVSAPVFGVPTVMSPEVHDADNRMLVTEAAQFFRGHKTKWWLEPQWPPPYPSLRIEPWTPEQARMAFRAMWTTSG